MKGKSKLNQREKFLSKTQEVRYQKEFKQADSIYNELTKKGNRS
ncbi:YfhE family protein [Virgibacillus profundi]|uniref:YfhE family protein n=1 Tax=Virgibacillus profundi TaxID=2024555 RepID=A0A2A2I8T9_9BACI|nr:YfhE family protein [Virgibacillus profundi]PAV28129.1 YfhE family protein [Virgibacillus profundi]PXY52434.1 YfhE family protein [Virgibacillus profundi]